MVNVNHIGADVKPYARKGLSRRGNRAESQTGKAFCPTKRQLQAIEEAERRGEISLARVKEHYRKHGYSPIANAPVDNEPLYKHDIFPDGKLVPEWAGDFGELPEYNPRQDPEYKKLSQMEMDFLWECHDDSGTVCENFKRLKMERKVLEDESIEDAERMERLRPGSGFAGPSWDLYRVGVQTKHIEQIPPVRKNIFFPVWAKLKRDHVVRYLEYLVDTYRPKNAGINEETGKPNNPHVYPMVITNGPRVRMEDCPAAWREMADQCRRLNAEPWFKKYFNFWVRSNEVGSIYHRDKDKHFVFDADGEKIRHVDHEGRQTYHPHCHLILYQKSFIPEDQYAGYLQRIRDWFDGKCWIGDGLREVREAVKYLVKPNEKRFLPDDEYLLMFDTLFGLNTVQPMGMLRETIADFKERKKRLHRPCKSNGWRWMEKDNHNANFGEKLDIEEEPEEEEKKDRSQPSQVIVARHSPTPFGSNVSEPLLLVAVRSGHPLDLDALMGNQAVKRMERVSREPYRASLAALGDAAQVVVHKSPLNVRTSGYEKTTEQTQQRLFRGGDPPVAASSEPPQNPIHEKTPDVDNDRGFSVGTGTKPVSQTLMFESFNVNQMFD